MLYIFWEKYVALKTKTIICEGNYTWLRNENEVTKAEVHETSPSTESPQLHVVEEICDTY